VTTSGRNIGIGIARWYGVLAFSVGALTALQSRANGRLAIHLKNGVLAGLVSNLVGWLILTAIVIFSIKDRQSFLRVLHASRHREIRIWETLGGFGGACFLAVQSSSVPVIGIALFTIGLVAGQTSSSLLVDKLGISPSGKKPITGIRVLTALLTLTGVSIAVLPKLSQGNFDVLYIVLALIIGVIVSFQQAINGRLNVLSQRPLVTAWFNFGAGTALLIVFLIINLGLGGEIGTFPHNPLIYTGGLIGLIFIAISAYTIKELGVLNFIMFSVAGQVVTALIVDAIAPAKNARLSGWVIVGTLITFISVSIPKLRESLNNRTVR
jgi:transporter family-2 protein